MQIKTCYQLPPHPNPHIVNISLANQDARHLNMSGIIVTVNYYTYI